MENGIAAYEVPFFKGGSWEFVMLSEVEAFCRKSTFALNLET